MLWWLLHDCWSIVLLVSCVCCYRIAAPLFSWNVTRNSDWSFCLIKCYCGECGFLLVKLTNGVCYGPAVGRDIVRGGVRQCQGELVTWQLGGWGGWQRCLGEMHRPLMTWVAWREQAAWRGRMPRSLSRHWIPLCLCGMEQAAIKVGQSEWVVFWIDGWQWGSMFNGPCPVHMLNAGSCVMLQADGT